MDLDIKKAKWWRKENQKLKRRRAEEIKAQMGQDDSGVNMEEEESDE